MPRPRHETTPPAGEPRSFRVGLIGCGYRGIAIASQALSEFGSAARLTAVADVFPDRLQQAIRSLKGKHPDQVSIEKGTRFSGLDSYRQLLASDVDIVLLATPPGFRPLHFEAAVRAGKHIYMEKPVATDAPGVRRFMAALNAAHQQELVVIADLPRRRLPAYRETISRLQQGAIGQLQFARVYCNTNARKPAMRRKGQSELEYQLRNWQQFQWTSGDCIVDQHAQNLDVINWLVGDHPIEAQGAGGRHSGDHASTLGDVFDHHAVEYTYRGGMRLLSMCRQASDCWSSVSEWAHGTEGWCDISAGKIYDLKNKLVWRASEPSVTVSPAAELFSAFASRGLSRASDAENLQGSAKCAAESTMTAIMGRMATYSGKLVQWDECLANQQLLAKIDDLHALNDPAPAIPQATGQYWVPVPGQDPPS